jgi:hypothetical protein
VDELVGKGVSVNRGVIVIVGVLVGVGEEAFEGVADGDGGREVNVGVVSVLHPKIRKGSKMNAKIT